MAHFPLQDLGLIFIAAVTLFLLLKWLRKPAIFCCLIAGFVLPACIVVSAQETAETIVETVQEVAEAPPKVEPPPTAVVPQKNNEFVSRRVDTNQAAQTKAGQPSLPGIIHDLGLILIVAAVMLLVFKWLRQPVILGYLIAGFFVGPYFLPTDPSPSLDRLYGWLYRYLPEFVPQMLQIRDMENIHVWAELGVIFILFCLGLEFSFKKLLAIGRVAAVAGGFKVISTTLIGFFIGQMFGWNNIESIFFGAMIAMSSSPIILKIFDDLKLKGRAYAPIVSGALVVENLLAMLLLVMLSSIAISKTFVGEEIIFSSMKLVFFLVLWLIMGIFLLPWLLKWCRKLLNDEILSLVSMGLCFLMVIVACDVGFSSALGAFVMGSILAETSKGTRIEHLMRPIRGLFSAVFFVYVGMMINPAILYHYAGTVVLITCLAVFIKFFGMGLGALIAGCSIRNSMCAGLCMVQIGEFAFIIATLGMRFEVIGKPLFSVIVATSAITTLMAPYLIFFSGTIAKWLDRFIPEKFALVALRYEISMDESADHVHIPLVFWRTHGLAIMLNVVIVVAIILGVPLLIPESHMHSPISFLWLAVTLLLVSPCLWGVLEGRAPRPEQYDSETLSRLRQLEFGINVFRLVAGSILIVFFVSRFMNVQTPAGLITSECIPCFLFLFGPLFDWLYQRIETRFVTHLSDKERSLVEDRATQSHLMPWEATLTEFTLSEYSPLVMKTLLSSDIKRQFGVTVAIINRGGKNIVAPRADEFLLPRDRLFLIGTYEQLFAVQAVIEFHLETESPEFDDDQFGMVPLRLQKEHAFVGKMIRECGARESVNGLIVGVEHNDERFLNPNPSMVLQEGDLVWLVGEKRLFAKL